MIKINKLTIASPFNDIAAVCQIIAKSNKIATYEGKQWFDVETLPETRGQVISWNSTLGNFDGAFYFFEVPTNERCKTENVRFIGQLNAYIEILFNEELRENDISCNTDWNRRKIKFVKGELNSWSKDPSTKVSAALFNGKYNICSSYNGFPPGVEDTPERLNNRELKYKIVQHAEANLISTCARLGIKTEGMSMVVSAFPCTTCAGQIISAGIKEVITVEPSDDLKQRWAEDFKLSRELFDEAGVILTIVDE